MHIAADPGSSHMGQKHLIREIIDQCKAAEVDSIKFQLFPNDMKYTGGGNVWMSPDLFEYAYKTAKLNRIAVTASVFGNKEAEFLSNFKIPYIKFAYSMKHQIPMIEAWLMKGTKVVVTTDLMHVDELPKHKDLIKLWTATVDGKTLYPCHFDIDFYGIFEKFDGFSDHTIGLKAAVKAKYAGATWIEKHVTPHYDDVKCPDKAFALDLRNLKEFVSHLR